MKSRIKDFLLPIMFFLLPIMLVLLSLTFLICRMSNTYEYYEVELELTDDHQPYAVYYYGDDPVRFDDIDIDEIETYNMEVYKAQDVLIPTYHFVGEQDVYIIDGKAYVRYSRFRTMWGSSPLAVR